MMKRRRINCYRPWHWLPRSRCRPRARIRHELAVEAGSTGTLTVRLTDAPFSTDSVKSVDIFVVRVEGRVADTDDNDANANLDNGGSAGWQVLASPNASFNLLALQNGASSHVRPGARTRRYLQRLSPHHRSDQVERDAQERPSATEQSSPDVTFPSASKSGIKIVLSEPVKIVGGATTTLLVDFDVNNSFVQRGNSIEKNGLLFKPVIKGSIVDAATVNREDPPRQRDGDRSHLRRTERRSRGAAASPSARARPAAA